VPKDLHGNARVHIVVAALFANAVPYLLFAVAEQSVNSSMAGIINATTPLWTVLLALAVRHQKTVTNWQVAGLFVGFIGAVLIFTPWSTAAGLTSAGALECLAASVGYAVSYVYMDKFLARRGIGPVVLSACQLGAAVVMLAVALDVTGVRAPHVTAVSVAAIAVLGIVGTGFAYVLNYQIITSEGATVASTVTYLLPVVAIVLGVLVLGESVTVAALAGIVLVLAGVALTRRRVQAREGTTSEETGTDDPVIDDRNTRTTTSVSRARGWMSYEGRISASRSWRLRQIRQERRAAASADETRPPTSPERDARYEPGDWPPSRGR
jgi:drug/metabolite transporter (DMT)-like permease